MLSLGSLKKPDNECLRPNYSGYSGARAGTRLIVPALLLSVLISTHNPHPKRLQRTLASLQAQTLPASEWETILIDNASVPTLVAKDWTVCSADNLRLIRESEIGLSHARQCGFLAARGNIAVLVDDDNVLAPDYLATVLALFTAHPKVGALGGRSVPEFEVSPPAWTEEFYTLLALRDLGESPLVSQGLQPASAAKNKYPSFAPIGAGMALRRAAWTAWLDARQDPFHAITDRRGDELTSGGDNDIVLCAMRAGWEVGYFSELALTHLIPPGRLKTEYLARLNRGIQKSWMQVLTLHEANPWPTVSRWSVALRKLKAWYVCRAWASPAAHIRWQGACGHFEGRIHS